MKQPPVISVQLVHIQGPFKGEIQDFSEGVITIGRQPSCQLRFPPELTIISRNHAEIMREGNRFKLIDRSANGTFVNGKKVTEAYLKSGDVLTFAEGGPKVSFLTQVKEGQEEIAEKPPVSIQWEIPAAAFEQPPDRKPEAQEPEELLVQHVKVPLIIQYGPTLRSFKELPITIGKNPRCDFVLDHPAVLDRHVQLFFSQSQYWVKDLTGQRLVQIARQPIGLQQPLKVDDVLALSPKGPHLSLSG